MVSKPPCSDVVLELQHLFALFIQVRKRLLGFLTEIASWVFFIPKGMISSIGVCKAIITLKDEGSFPSVNWVFLMALPILAHSSSVMSHLMVSWVWKLDFVRGIADAITCTNLPWVNSTGVIDSEPILSAASHPSAIWGHRGCWGARIGPTSLYICVCLILLRFASGPDSSL